MGMYSIDLTKIFFGKIYTLTFYLTILLSLMQSLFVIEVMLLFILFFNPGLVETFNIFLILNNDLAYIILIIHTQVNIAFQLLLIKGISQEIFTFLLLLHCVIDLIKHVACCNILFLQQTEIYSSMYKYSSHPHSHFFY